MAFVLSRTINLQIDANSLKNAQSTIDAAFQNKTVNVGVNLVVSPSAQQSLNQLNATVTSLNTNLQTLTTTATAAGVALSSLGAGLGRVSSGSASVSSVAKEASAAVQ